MGYPTDEPMKVSGEVNGKKMEMEIRMPAPALPSFAAPKERTFNQDEAAETDAVIAKIRRLLHGMPVSHAKRIISQLELEAEHQYGYVSAEFVTPKPKRTRRVVL